MMTRALMAPGGERVLVLRCRRRRELGSLKMVADSLHRESWDQANTTERARRGQTQETLWCGDTLLSLPGR